MSAAETLPTPEPVVAEVIVVRQPSMSVYVWISHGFHRLLLLSYLIVLWRCVECRFWNDSVCGETLGHQRLTQPTVRILFDR